MIKRIVHMLLAAQFNTKAILADLQKLHKVKSRYVQPKFKIYDFAEPNECFRNASKVALADPNAKVVLGYCFSLGIPFEHAWIEIDGVQYDVTFKPKAFDAHYEMLKIDSAEIHKYYESTTKVVTIDRYLKSLIGE